MQNLLKSHLALFAVNLLYAINYLVAKDLMPGVMGANGFILLRVSGATLLFWLVYSFRFEKIKSRDLLILATCGLFGVAVNQLFFFNGLMRTSPVNASVIMTTTPILVFILSLFILKEKPQLIKVVGLIIGAIGAILFTLQTKQDETASLLGDLFIFANAASYALYMVLVKPLMKRYKPLTVITWVFTFGFIFVLCWPLGHSEFQATNFGELSSHVLSLLLFVVVGVTFLPYLLMVYAMKRVSPSVSSIYIYIQPVLTAFFVYLYFQFGMTDYTNDFSWSKILCAIFVFIGVYLVIKPAKTANSSKDFAD
jgi:drug/metabolite transporter (DMT)-like permease